MHDSVLERARLIQRSVVGRDHYLTLDPARLEAAERWLDENCRFWAVRLDNLVTIFQAKDNGR